MTDARTYGDELAVVTVTYSPGETLGRFLDTLERATDRRPRVILADNGSTDGEPERAAEERADVDFVPTGGNLGYGSGANRGVAQLSSEYGWVVIANPDLEWQPGSLDELLAAAKRWPRGGSFGPLIKEPGGEVYPSARMLPSIGRGAGHAVFGKVWPGNPWTRAYQQSEAQITERPAGWLSGSCLLLRREAFDSVDGFDPRYFMYFEDVDLGDRLRRKGWLNIYVPSAEVMHIGGRSTSKAAKRMLLEHHRSAYRYLADRHRGPIWAPLRLALRAALAIRARIETR
ncbi:N-acetylglucosaminyl-diphospho-decaprenol L-rhamnosyltransferase [Saccharopolyspora antimicrobica]|uniref:N-acetylglucosaminyl-diphospho-decaprenol L-rhamnosyltransferase n=1 Tax=Saccharopolyspora antimicrobica TaxID=455193 RepID=A0A1I5LBF1_9PSEU|nr:glycosyltransferase family 2 protein [Saccharopolyspora antimicrobica]RKT85431.1 N-acetylglucosaminyl-diphospho-decaprenol L-rhamnosyltransferase [Saccharopolyspora antimicrobica]SFO94548.1 N-acetylglucosaminyl-diphospho-decaprenol L-rhamnosyltransferase [Saccharopolyspora antimicrobica]